MKNLITFGIISLVISGCVAGGNSIPYTVDENTRSKDYAHIKDPTETFEEKVHRFQITSKCGSLQRSDTVTDIIGLMESSDCGENSVRSEIACLTSEPMGPNSVI